MPYITKLKNPRTCDGCRAYTHRVASSEPSCWLGEKLFEQDVFGPRYTCQPARGWCYKPRTYKELMFVHDTFYKKGKRQ